MFDRIKEWNFQRKIRAAEIQAYIDKPKEDYAVDVRRIERAFDALMGTVSANLDEYIIHRFLTYAYISLPFSEYLPYKMAIWAEFGLWHDWHAGTIDKDSEGRRDRDERMREKFRGYNQGRPHGKSSHTLTKRENAIKLMGVTDDSTAKEIKMAYRKLAQKHHPDKFSGVSDSALAAANRNFAKLNAAYELLK